MRQVYREAKEDLKQKQGEAEESEAEHRMVRLLYVHVYRICTCIYVISVISYHIIL